MSKAEATPIIEFQRVSKRYGSQPILKEIDLRISSGQRVALMGESGCGKTTLLRCMNGLERVSDGRLIVNGQDLTQPGLNFNRFRAKIGMVFQQFNLFPHLSVLDNILLGPLHVKGVPRPEAVEHAHHLLEQVGIGHKALAHPDQLSGGQKQRVAIARALAMRPDILLMDEPTSALDPPMSREVLAVIEQVAQSITTIIVTHELRFVAHLADRLIFMEQGRIVDDGPPEQVMTHPSAESTRRYLEIFQD